MCFSSVLHCLQGIDTGAGMVKFDAPIQVAKVVSDSEVHTSGVQVYPSSGKAKYQVLCPVINLSERVSGSFFKLFIFLKHQILITVLND